MRLLAQNDVKVPAQGIFYAPGWEKSPFEGMKYWFSVVIVPVCSVVLTHRAGHAADSFEPLPSVFGIKSLYVSCEAVDAGLTPPVSLLNDCLGLARREDVKEILQIGEQVGLIAFHWKTVIPTLFNDFCRSFCLAHQSIGSHSDILSIHRFEKFLLLS